MNIGAGIGIGFAEPTGVLAFEYEQSSGCQNGSDITPVINTPGGTFSASPAGLSINSSTGVIDVSASTAGSYTVTYSIGPTEDTITIQATDDASFAYSASSYSQSDADPTPTITGLSGGTFSAGSGLVFVDSGSNTGSSTGEIDLSASTVASYTITYTTAGTCPNTSTQTVGIISVLAQVSNVYSMEFDGVNDFIKVREFNNSVSAEGIIFGNITISLWFKIGIGTNYSHRNFVGGSNSTNSGLFQYFGVHNGFPEMYFQNDGGYQPIASTNIYDDTWHHIAISYDTSVGTYGTFKAYLDGVNTFTLALSASPTAPSWSRSRMLVIGGYRDTPFRNFPGSIDELANFNVVLTEAEVQSIYNATETGKTADLNDLSTPPIAWYRMGD
jgi:hypothetical protein